jgi:uncharacterized protein YerC
VGTIAEMIATDKTIEIAKNMLKEGYPVKSIHKVTGLDEATIHNLQKEVV